MQYTEVRALHIQRHTYIKNVKKKGKYFCIFDIRHPNHLRLNIMRRTYIKNVKKRGHALLLHTMFPKLENTVASRTNYKLRHTTTSSKQSTVPLDRMSSNIQQFHYLALESAITKPSFSSARHLCDKAGRRQRPTARPCAPVADLV